MSDDEYDAVVALLDREPTDPELAMYSVMWSEHCSYKSSRSHLRRFPTEAPWVVIGPGEGAGVVDLGDGWLAAIRIESHNHPSFVEPYQGAATGVGGILRDIFSVGARPIALFDQIRFGDLADPRNRYLFGGVVAGIAGYGNAVGVPTVGGEVEFDDSYAGNPLVNVLCLGILRREQLMLSRAGTAGTVAVLLGAATGRDGIGGASILASASFDETSGDKRPSVQVGDPFEEKKLIEACLELYGRGLVEAIQDLGAAGICCAASETVAKGGMGIDLDLDAVPLRETGMTPAEILVSESQERMLAFVAPDRLDEVLAVAERWEIDASPVGTVHPGGRMRVRNGDGVVADIPAASLSDGPLLDRAARRPAELDGLWSRPGPPAPATAADALRAVLDRPGVGDPSWIYEQYDHMLFVDTVVGPGHDAALIRVPGTDKALAVSTDGHGRRCRLDPRRGAARLVYEAALNVAVTGASPLAAVDNLNFGNPEKPEVMWQFAETVDGMAGACRALGIPVIGGNVSFYNETGGADIHPTPVVGVLGLADPMPVPPPRLDRGEPGMSLWLIGADDEHDLAGSEYAAAHGAPLAGRPLPPDDALGPGVVAAAARLAAGGTAPVIHDVSRGGMAVAVAEICMRSGVGATLASDDWRHLFSESPHRFVAATRNETAMQIALDGVPARFIGTLGGGAIGFGDGSSIPLAAASEVWRQAIPKRMR